MMSSCQVISDMIPEYINKKTTTKQNADVARHIASCLMCRADFALWLSIEQSLNKSNKNVPVLDLQTVFNKIPNKEVELEKIINSGSYYMAFDIIRYVFKTIKTTYKLASLV